MTYTTLALWLSFLCVWLLLFLSDDSYYSPSLSSGYLESYGHQFFLMLIKIFVDARRKHSMCFFDVYGQLLRCLAII